MLRPRNDTRNQSVCPEDDEDFHKLLYREDSASGQNGLWLIFIRSELFVHYT